MAVLEQDYFRMHMFHTGEQAATKPTRLEIIKQSALAALEYGHHVILEGILGSKGNGRLIQELLAEHPEENYIFYFDISFKETVKRHATRGKTAEFGEKEMCEWYLSNDRLNHPNETIIPEHLNQEETIKLIEKTCGL